MNARASIWHGDYDWVAPPLGSGSDTGRRSPITGRFISRPVEPRASWFARLLRRLGSAA